MDGGFVVIGALFLLGIAADTLGRRTKVPRVTLLLLMGVAAGPAVLGAVPQSAFDWYDGVSTLALTMVAFLLGNALRRDRLAAHGRAILTVSIAVVLATLAIVALGLWLMGAPPELALLLGAIATATDPAATDETLREAGAAGGFADTLRGVVAIDDAWGMLVFALAVVGAEALSLGVWNPAALGLAAVEVGGAVVLGLALGLPAAWLTGRLKAGQPTRLEALGLVFLAAGLALEFEVSFLLTGMVAGAVIANFADHHERAFHEIEELEQPLLILFFLLAGAAMDPAALLALGTVGAGFVGLRIAARLVGGWAGGRLGGMPGPEARWVGPALLAQAGVAVGMALVAAERFPDHAETILTLTIGTTVLFELMGPAAILLALRRLRQ